MITIRIVDDNDENDDNDDNDDRGLHSAQGQGCCRELWF